MAVKNQGQITLIVLLIMVTLLTIGLSFISRSVTDISISKDEEESMRAFSAAEAGIEEALRQSSLAAGSLPAPSVTGVTRQNVEVTPNTTVDDITIQPGQFLNVFLTGTAGTVNVGWTENDPQPGLEFSLYNNNGAVTRMTGTIENSCTTNFTQRILPVGINTSIGDFLLRIGTYCASTTLTVSGILSDQGYTIDSRASVGSETESKTSALEVTKSAPSLPDIFDYVLFSSGSIE